MASAEKERVVIALAAGTVMENVRPWPTDSDAGVKWSEHPANVSAAKMAINEYAIFLMVIFLMVVSFSRPT